MKRIRDFKSPRDQASQDELRRQVVTFEGNVSDAFDEVAVFGLRRLRVLQRVSNSNALLVGPGHSVGITAAVVQVQLAVPGPQDAGKFLAICKGLGAPSNTIVFAPKGSLVNGAASYLITANGLLKLFYCDGVDYWTDQ